MPQLAVTGQRAKFDVHQQFRLKPNSLGLLDLFRERLDAGLELFGSLRQIAFAFCTEAIFDLSCVEQLVLLPPPEVDAIKPAALIGDAGDHESFALAARALAPIGASAWVIGRVLSFRDQALKLQSAGLPEQRLAAAVEMLGKSDRAFLTFEQF